MGSPRPARVGTQRAHLPKTLVACDIQASNSVYDVHIVLRKEDDLDMEYVTVSVTGHVGCGCVGGAGMKPFAALPSRQCPSPCGFLGYP